jgi:hypothetical protein
MRLAIETMSGMPADTPCPDLAPVFRMIKGRYCVLRCFWRSETVVRHGYLGNYSGERCCRFVTLDPLAR